MCVVHSVCIFVFYCRRTFVYCIRKITVFLATSASNSLSGPQLTAVRYRYPVLTSLPFMK